MPRQLTIRKVPDEIARRLDTLSHDRRQSVNSLVLGILEAAVGESPRRRRLARYATWTEEDRREFESAIAQQREIDDELWG